MVLASFSPSVLLCWIVAPSSRAGAGAHFLPDPVQAVYAASLPQVITVNSSNRFARLLHRLDLSEQSPSVFVGGAGEGGVGGESRLFGGLVAAQAVMAAQKTVESFGLHSLHAYFSVPVVRPRTSPTTCER